jgi:hypothetical protein
VTPAAVYHNQKKNLLMKGKHCALGDYKKLWCLQKYKLAATVTPGRYSKAMKINGEQSKNSDDKLHV